MRVKIFIAITFIASIFTCDALAQKMPERRLVRKGNRQYEKGAYDTSIDNYSKALQYDPKSFEAKFNLANAQVRKELIDKAEQSLRKLAQDSTRTDIERGEVAYNLGNTLFIQQRLEEALGCYRDAMRFNPADTAAKFNYALTKELLKNQQNQNQQQDQNNQQNQNQNQQNQNQQQEQQDNKEDKQDKQDNQNQNSPEEQISDREQQAMLDAIQAQEDKTQEKLKEKNGVIIRGGKNW